MITKTFTVTSHDEGDAPGKVELMLDNDNDTIIIDVTQAESIQLPVGTKVIVTLALPNEHRR